MPVARAGLARVAFACALFCLAAGLLAQEPVPTPAASAPPAETTAALGNDHPYTLHVYADLLQIPTLVVDPDGKPYPDIQRTQFQLQLDSGPKFAPSALHLEGNEPLSLAIILDASGAEKELLQALDAPSTHGIPAGLLPHDHVSIYAFDCKTVRSADDVAADSPALAHSVAQALASPILHKPGYPRKTCASTRHLWDTIALAALRLAEFPGRRAILVISDGEDGSSSTTADKVHLILLTHAIALFALQNREDGDSPSTATTGAGLSRISMVAAPGGNLLVSLCSNNGGLYLPTDADHLARELNRFVALLRARFVLQFPRPRNGEPGMHHLEVHVPQRGAIVRAAGMTYPERSQEELNDPNAVPGDPSKVPVLGNAKPKGR